MQNILRTGIRSRCCRFPPGLGRSNGGRAWQSTGRHVIIITTRPARGGGPSRLRRLAVLSLLGAISLSSGPESSTVDSNTARTREERLLSRSEAVRGDARLRAGVHHQPTLQHLVHRIGTVLANWIYEPIATTLRFFHLFIIFMPVVLAAPLTCFGPVCSEYDNERWGAVIWYRFLVHQMEHGGPTFIKALELGQWAASRRDIFPTTLCKIMCKLHSNVKPHSMHYTKSVIETAFDGRPFDTIFEAFIEQPLGVGAIAQVYQAKINPELLPPSIKSASTSKKSQLRKIFEPLVKQSPTKTPSTWVAIKIRHPGIESLVYRDLKILRFFANLVNAIPTIEWLSLPEEVSQFSRMMRMQLDLCIEAENLKIFRTNFESRNTVTFPVPYLEYSKRNILIEEFAHGISLENFLDRGAGVFHRELADMGLDAFLHMLLIDNFVHSDLHPGNIFVRFYKSRTVDVARTLKALFYRPHLQPEYSEDKTTDEAIARLQKHQNDEQSWVAELAKLEKEGFRPQLIFIDTGLVTELSDYNWKNFLDLFISIATFDGYRAGELMIERSRQPEAVIDSEIFALKMQHLVLGVKETTFALGQVKIGDVLQSVLNMVRKHHVRVEGEFANVVISVLLLEGIGRQLDPAMDLFKSAIPILREVGISKTATVKSFDTKTLLIWLKFWLGLEARRLVMTTVQEVEAMVKFDRVCPNI